MLNETKCSEASGPQKETRRRCERDIQSGAQILRFAQDDKCEVEADSTIAKACSLDDTARL
jgi:hypothetical protein